MLTASLGAICPGLCLADSLPRDSTANAIVVSNASAQDQKRGGSSDASPAALQMYLGAITRGPVDQKRIALCFTAHEYAEGAPVILDSLARHHGKGSFFLTGVCVANTNYAGLIRRMLRDGHYVGPHSDKHVLYCSWEKTRETLVSKEEFRSDLLRNVEKIRLHRLSAGIGENQNAVRFFLPAFEHYNSQIASWTAEMGMVLVNFTPGTRSNADYTGEADKNFVPSETIYRSILGLEARDPHGLNGFLLLLHLGSGPGRTDKFHTYFPKLLDDLAGKGYEFVTVGELLKK